jgi:hypothetical protein
VPASNGVRSLNDLSSVSPYSRTEPEKCYPSEVYQSAPYPWGTERSCDMANIRNLESVIKPSVKKMWGLPTVATQKKAGPDLSGTLYNIRRS